MCGRLIVDYDEMMSVAGGSELAEWFTASRRALARPQGQTPTPSSWNVAPTQQIPVAFTDPKTGAPRWEAGLWSLAAHGHHLDPRIGGEDGGHP